MATMNQAALKCVADEHNEVFFWTYMPKGGVEFWFHAWCAAYGLVEGFSFMKFAELKVDLAR